MMFIARKLFVIPLANNDHGKTTLLNALLSQGLGATSPGRKGQRELISPYGRYIDAYVYTRSYQETEKSKHKKIVRALDGNDPDWRTRELIIFSSHAVLKDVVEMIDLAHSAGFDAICAAVVLGSGDRKKYANIWQLNWDERWTIPNYPVDTEAVWRPQCEALGRDLWTWICRALAS